VVRLYDDKNYKDRVVVLQPDDVISNLGADAYAFNDKASSLKIAGSTVTC
jgi:hypothetical protein